MKIIKRKTLLALVLTIGHTGWLFAQSTDNVNRVGMNMGFEVIDDYGNTGYAGYFMKPYYHRSLGDLFYLSTSASISQGFRPNTIHQIILKYHLILLDAGVGAKVNLNKKHSLGVELGIGYGHFLRDYMNPYTQDDIDNRTLSYQYIGYYVRVANGKLNWYYQIRDKVMFNANYNLNYLANKSSIPNEMLINAGILNTSHVLQRIGFGLVFEF